jgi:hypothetical protein
LSLVVCQPIVSAQTISLNIANGTTGNTAVDGAETFGVPNLGTVVGNWNNLKGSGPLVWDDGSPSAVSVEINAPGGYNFFGAGYINTPLNYGMADFPGTEGTAIILGNLNGEFPEGYFAIVYVIGFATNTGASISDGTTTYYYQSANPVPGGLRPEDLVQGTLEAEPAEGTAPVAYYVVFGDTENPLTADEITFSLEHLSGGGAGLGGVQIVAAGNTGGGGGDDPTWTDPALGTYFLDATDGDDTNDGKSPETAWQTLGRLNSVFFKPGDVVLFKAGTVFTGSFYLIDSGTPEAPIILGAYGTGAKPRLEGGPNDLDVIYIEGNECIEIRDLEISNYHPAGSITTRYGIRIVAPAASGEIRNMHFHGLDFTWIKGSGADHESRAIDADSTTNDTVKPYTRWNSFIVEDCYFANIDGRAVQLNDRCNSLSDLRLRGLDYYPTIGFVFQNNTGLNIYRNMLQLGGTKDAVIQHNYMSGTQEGSAFWPFDAEGTLVQFNDFRHLRNEGADSFVCHFDYNCVDTLMQYNFGYDVDGGLIEIIVLSDFAFFQEGAIARYNVGVDIGFRNKENSAGIMFSGRVTESQVYNNTMIFRDEQPAYKAIAVNNWGGEWPYNNFIHNNLFLATGSPVSFDDSDRLAQLGNVVSHNLYHGNMPVLPEDLSPVTGDPLLVDVTSLDPADLKLTAGSPAIGTGLPIVYNGGRDFFDNPLPSGLVPSIGFHEYKTEGLPGWAGYLIDGNGFVDTGRGFLGLLWVGAAESGDADWVYSVSSKQWMYLPEDLIIRASGALIYVHEASQFEPANIQDQWFFSAAHRTWMAAFGEPPVSGPAWIHVLDLSDNP